jgi:flavin reductase (DIM6/NTAB) family NADH-FMN oxidoreductase RutF
MDPKLRTARAAPLTDAQANLFCVVDGKLSYGTHTIFVGRVDAIRLHGETRPLIYGDGRFIDS